mmetsp:Transcript_9702/g.11176  ORF Transcript_9702/g.11176 Transcript_9702/m.11176 type:complete len:81 (+) Transcript_9702:642-884(+)
MQNGVDPAADLEHSGKVHRLPPPWETQNPVLPLADFTHSGDRHLRPIPCRLQHPEASCANLLQFCLLHSFKLSDGIGVVV